MCEVRGVILGLVFVGITLISHFPHPTSHFSYKLQFIIYKYLKKIYDIKYRHELKGEHI